MNTGISGVCQHPERFCQMTQLMKTSNSPCSTVPRNRRQDVSLALLWPTKNKAGTVITTAWKKTGLEDTQGEWAHGAAQHPNGEKPPGIRHIEVGKRRTNRLTPREMPS